jgi:hypothetical protein
VTSPESWREATGRFTMPTYDPDEHRWMTQIGGRTFKEEPRWHREISLSVLVGRHSANDAVQVSFRRPAVPKDQVRFFKIAELVVAEYLPHPMPLPEIPDHACIRAPILEDQLERHQAWWARPERVKLQELARN